MRIQRGLEYYDIQMTSDGDLIFQHDGAADDVTFDTSGNVGIGTASPTYKLDVESNAGVVTDIVSSATSGTIDMLRFRFEGMAPNDTSSAFLQCTDTTTTRCIIRSNGDLQNTNNEYGQTSDERIKESITDANSQWNDIKALRVRNFKRKDNIDLVQIGVVAQEVEASGMNGLISKNPPNEFEIENCGISEDDTVRGVKYSVLYMKAVKALQEAMERIEGLESKVEALENA
jgi:hypothetical protein